MSDEVNRTQPAPVTVITAEDPLIRVGLTFARFGGMTWPRAGGAAGDLNWKLRYAQEQLTDSDLLQAASIIGAYCQMVHDPESKRREVIRQLRRAEAIAPYEGEHDV